jgi:hypothetical protein
LRNLLIVRDSNRKRKRSDPDPVPTKRKEIGLIRMTTNTKKIRKRKKNVQDPIVKIVIVKKRKISIDRDMKRRTIDPNTRRRRDRRSGNKKDLKFNLWRWGMSTKGRSQKSTKWAVSSISSMSTTKTQQLSTPATSEKKAQTTSQK